MTTPGGLMTPEAPEFHTKTLSPLSPLPTHPSQPSHIPVLRNQTDPVFNMTSTHLDHEPSHPDVAIPKDPVPEPTETAEESPSADSSFSDAYKEQPDGEEHKQDEVTKQGSDVSDDYAMTFDSDGEGHADSQDISQAIIEPETKSSLITVSEIAEPSSPPNQSANDQTHDGPTTGLPKPSPSPSHPANNETPSANQAQSSKAKPLAEHAESKPLIHDDVSSEGIDIQQLLDNITANAEKKDAANAALASNPPTVPIPQNSSGLPSHSSLPPRPNAPQKRQYDDIQKYHATPAGLPQQPFRSPGIPTSLIAAGAPGTSTDPRNGLPPPPSATFPSTLVDPRGGLQYPLNTNFRPSYPSPSPISPASYTQINRSLVQGNPSEADDLDAKWGPEIQRIYDDFLENERQFVTEGLWDRFPNGSRLFIGNLPSEKVTKRDIFHVFHPYGKIAQISIKQAYGFVQFYDSAACYTALQREQGSEIREKRIHLEISKPQKNTRNAQAASGRRSRSPDHSRGGMQDRGGRSGQGRGDRYEPRAAPQTRVDEYGRPLRIRDDYRPAARSPTPPRGNFRTRDDYASRARDSYNSRDRRRSRSRSPPYGQRDLGRYRERSLSPRSREADEDASLQIPRRQPADVPDVQIVLMDQLDRNFISWVENEMRGRGIKVEVMFLSPRFPIQAVIRRQILEGVHAVSKLDMRSQSSSKIPLQVFDRQGGINNVRFDEYQDLEPKIAAELVLRAKNTQPQAPVQNTPYTQAPQYSNGTPYQQPPTAPAAPILGQLDNATLQQLLSGLTMPQQQQNGPAAAANAAIDLSGILTGLNGQQKGPQQSYQQAAADPYANIASNPALMSLLGNGAAPQPTQSQAQPQQQSAQQVQNIMAQLAKFRQ